jgi:hypothetical protein
MAARWLAEKLYMGKAGFIRAYVHAAWTSNSRTDPIGLHLNPPLIRPHVPCREISRIPFPLSGNAHSENGFTPSQPCEARQRVGISNGWVPAASTKLQGAAR